MAKRNEADAGSLSFKDRSLSKAAARELFDTQSSAVLGGIIDTAVVRIKNAKAVKAAKATEAYFSLGQSRSVTAKRHGKPTGIFRRSTNPAA